MRETGGRALSGPATIGGGGAVLMGGLFEKKGKKVLGERLQAFLLRGETADLPDREKE